MNEYFIRGFEKTAFTDEEQKLFRDPLKMGLRGAAAGALLTPPSILGAVLVNSLFNPTKPKMIKKVFLESLKGNIIKGGLLGAGLGSAGAGLYALKNKRKGEK